MIDTRRPTPPPPHATSAPASSQSPPSPEPNRFTVPHLSGPGWLATTGATLLLVAAIVVVAGQWSTIGPTARFAGLVGALFAIYFSAEAARRRIPTTAAALAVLAASVTAPVGIASVAALDGHWPMCITVGGAASLIACELQARRWQVRTLHAATVAAVLLLVAGISALSSIPLPLLGAMTSALALALGARHRSFVLAILVPLTPCLWILAAADIGPGVLARLGVVDAASWVVPTSTLIAGLTLAVAGHRSRRADIAGSALVVLAYSASATLIEAVLPLSAWLSVPGAVALLIGLSAFAGDRSIFSRWACEVRDVTAVLIATASWIAPMMVVLLRMGTAGAPLGGRLVLPAVVTLASLAVLAVTADRNSTMHDIVRIGAVAGTLALIASTGIETLWVAVLAIVTWAITSASTSWRSWTATSLLHATWALVAIALADAAPEAASALIVIATGIVVGVIMLTSDTTLASVVIPIPVMTGILMLVTQWLDALPALAAALAVGAVATTGLAMLRPGFNPSDSLALSLGAGAALVALGTGPAGLSLGLTLVAAQVWIYGVAFARTAFASLGAGMASVGLLSLWWTSGTNDLVIDWVAPYGADGQDLSLGAATIALIGAGIAMRTVQRMSSWLAYSPGLAVGFAWLLVAQSDPDAEWATLAGLVVGVLSVGLGGARRLAAPLVLGTIGLTATGIISIGDRLSVAPTWTWIAIGGAGLLAVAALLEHSERPLLPSRSSSTSEERNPTDPVDSVAEMFRQNFE